MKFNHTIKAGVCFITGFGLISSPAFAKDDDKALRLEPSTPWQLNYADDSCRLARIFGEDKERVILILDRFGPGDGFSLVAAGSPLKGHSTSEYAYVQFGEANEEKKINAKLGNFGDYEPALIFSRTSLAPQVDDDDKRDSDDEAESPDATRERVSPELEESINWIKIRRERRDPIYLETGSLGAPMVGMRKCTDELMTHWGIDLEKHRNLAVKVKPLESPSRWIRSSDYPKDAIYKGSQGIVKFRLSIGSDGKPTECHIQQSARPQDFDDAVCAALMRRAEFTPAVTKNGEAIASYWRSSVLFQMSR